MQILASPHRHRVTFLQVLKLPRTGRWTRRMATRTRRWRRTSMGRTFRTMSTQRSLGNRESDPGPIPVFGDRGFGPPGSRVPIPDSRLARTRHRELGIGPFPDSDSAGTGNRGPGGGAHAGDFLVCQAGYDDFSDFESSLMAHRILVTSGADPKPPNCA
jgi:hypothetical protein